MNGSSVATASDASPITDFSGELRIGHNTGSGAIGVAAFNGHIDEFRLINGGAVYNGNFTALPAASARQRTKRTIRLHRSALHSHSKSPTPAQMMLITILETMQLGIRQLQRAVLLLLMGTKLSEAIAPQMMLQKGRLLFRLGNIIGEFIWTLFRLMVIRKLVFNK